MDKLAVAGLLVLVLGVVMSILPFLVTNVNPDVSLAFLGIITATFGGLIFGADSFRRRIRLQGLTMTLALSGWMALASGVLIGLAGFLLASQVSCGCPASGPCGCTVLLYDTMIVGGLAASLAGAGLLLASSFASKKTRPLEARGRTSRLSGRSMTTLAAVLTIVVVFAVFSYWPGVFVTSVGGEETFIGGMPALVDFQHPHSPPFMTSTTPVPASGLRLPIGGELNYMLHFNSIPSYPKYSISDLAVTGGFSIIAMNASLPVVVSPADPSVSISFTIRGPYYPYYGTLSVSMTIRNLNQTI